MAMATMADAWVLANPAITAPIVGASRPEQLDDSLAAAEEGAAAQGPQGAARRDHARMAGGRRRTLMSARLARQRPVREPGAMTDIEPELAQVRERLLSWLLNDALQIWWAVGADKTGGGFHEAIDLAGKPVLAERRARVQARQIFTYAVAGELGWNGPWREAVRHGLDFYIGRYRRPDGLFVNALRADGSPSPANPHLYEQAFTLLAIATAGDPTLAPIADTLHERLTIERRGAAGGYTGFADDVSSSPTRTCTCSRPRSPGSSSRPIRAGARWPTRSPSSASRAS